MTWHAVRVKTADSTAVTRALFASGALAVQEEPGTVTTHFPTHEEAVGAAEEVRRLDAGASVEIHDTPPQDWSEWRGSVRAWRVAALTVAPPWLAPDAESPLTVVIDPGMAFGTGEHATTRGVLRLMQDVLRPGALVADLGTGSGVLAIAAAKLGAARVIGIEKDQAAVANAETNVRANHVDRVVTVIEGDAALLLPLIAPVELVLANIASLPLLALLPGIAAALAVGGAAIISGVLAAEAEGFRRAADRWLVVAELTEDDWWTAAIAPR